MKQNIVTYHASENIGPDFATWEFSGMAIRSPGELWSYSIVADGLPEYKFQLHLDPEFVFASTYKAWKDAALQEFHGKRALTL